jgi:uncharacterized membrane protein YgcG
MSIRFSLTNLLIAVGTILFINGCGGEKFQSHWKKSDIMVDGQVEDWTNYPVAYYEKDDTRIVLGFANDDTSLNIMIRFRDHRIARLFERRGVILWFDGKNQKDKEFGIQYVDPNARKMGLPTMEMFGRDFRREPIFMDQASEPNGSFSLISKDTVEIPQDGIEGIRAAVDFQQGLYCYEFSIPIYKNEVYPYAIKISSKQKVKLGVEIAPVSEEEKERIEEMMKERRQSRQGGSGRGGGMPGGGMRGGGMKGGGMRGGGPGRQIPDMDGKEMWMTVLLADSFSEITARLE